MRRSCRHAPVCHALHPNLAVQRHLGDGAHDEPDSYPARDRQTTLAEVTHKRVMRQILELILRPRSCHCEQCPQSGHLARCLEGANASIFPWNHRLILSGM